MSGLAITGMTAVRRRGVVHWEGPRPIDEDCVECGQVLRCSTSKRCPECAHRNRDAAALERLMQTLASNLSKPAWRPTCGECGCLLKSASETCPNCLLWAVRDAGRASWKRGFDSERSAA